VFKTVLKYTIDI